MTCWGKVGVLEAALKESVDKVQADERSLQTRHQAQLSTEKQVNLKLRAESALLKKNLTRFQFFLKHYYHNPPLPPLPSTFLF